MFKTKATEVSATYTDQSIPSPGGHLYCQEPAGPRTSRNKLATDAIATVAVRDLSVTPTPTSNSSLSSFPPPATGGLDRFSVHWNLTSGGTDRRGTSPDSLRSFPCGGIFDLSVNCQSSLHGQTFFSNSIPSS